jgi:IS30 family transposase
MANAKKGTAGKGTGATTRKAIKTAKKRGCSNAKIGKTVNRSASTISKISKGKIKNPPKGLASNIRKSCKKMHKK